MELPCLKPWKVSIWWYWRHKKQLAARASLQRPTSDKILIPSDLFRFCGKQLHGIKFVFITKQEIEATRPLQEKRFENGCTVPGTRENHCFKSIDEKRVWISRVSKDTASFITSVVQSSDCPIVSINSIQPGDYIACVYDNKWWIGNFCDTSLEERDALASFMHPHGPVYSFQWPQKKDTCWIPEQQIIAILPAPSADSTGWKSSSEVLKSIEETFRAMKMVSWIFATNFWCFFTLINM